MSNAAAPAQAAAPAAGTAAAPKSKKKLIVILAAGLLLGGGGAGSYFMLFAKSSGEDAHVEKKDDHGKPEPTADTHQRGKIVILNPIVVNLRGSSGTRYLKVAIALETQNQEAVDELKEITVPLTDFLRERLASAKLEELDNTEGRNRLKREMMQGINDLLSKGFVANLYFSEFVIQ
ncbi:MAG: flagellar basal body-associated FliL family protein [Planctomycetota bacterium]|nr:flagellar basal body-associated FliL family protein [Planctomycetota bacterium]